MQLLTMYSEDHTTNFKINVQVESKDIMTKFGFTKYSFVTNKGRNKNEFIMVQTPLIGKVWQLYWQRDEYNTSMIGIIQIFTMAMGYGCFKI